VSASTSPNAGARIKRLLAILLIFVLVGPPVGALAFILTLRIVSIGTDVEFKYLTWVAMLSAIYLLPFSYLIGVWPAAAAGLLVGLWQAFKGPARWWVALAIGILVGIGFLVATGQPIIHETEAGVAREQSTIMIVTCAATTMACWTIVRNWHFAARDAGATS
jgi:hypothetical protein